MANENASPLRCPLCEATIPEGHTKCIFCGTIVTREPSEKPVEKAAQPQELFLIGVLAVLGISLVAQLLGVLRMSPLGPRTLFFVAMVLLTHISVAILVMLDARRINVKAREYGLPWQWGVATLVIMPVALLVYGAVRPRCGARDHTRILAGSVVVWLLVAFYVNHTGAYAPAVPPEVQRQLDEQLNRTLEVRPPDGVDLTATVAPPQPPPQ